MITALAVLLIWFLSGWIAARAWLIHCNETVREDSDIAKAWVFFLGGPFTFLATVFVGFGTFLSAVGLGRLRKKVVLPGRKFFGVK